MITDDRIFRIARRAPTRPKTTLLSSHTGTARGPRAVIPKRNYTALQQDSDRWSAGKPTCKNANEKRFITCGVVENKSKYRDSLILHSGSKTLVVRSANPTAGLQPMDEQVASHGPVQNSFATLIPSRSNVQDRALQVAVIRSISGATTLRESPAQHVCMRARQVPSHATGPVPDRRCGEE